MAKNIHRLDSSVRKHYTMDKSDGLKLNPRLLYAGSLKRSRHWNEDLHAHEFCEIMFVLSGMGEVQIGEEIFPIRQGDLLVYNPRVSHREYTKGNASVEFAFFGLTDLRIHDLPPDHLLPEGCSPIIHTGDRAQSFQTCFRSLVEEAESKLPYSEVMSGYWAKLILVGILRQLNRDEQTLVRNDIFSRIYTYISENFAHIDSIDTLCRELFVSKYYISHVFKKYAGKPPIHFVTQCRISHAKKLLHETDLPIGEISALCGYTDYTSFFKVFKRLEGITPAQYRKSSGS